MMQSRPSVSRKSHSMVRYVFTGETGRKVWWTIGLVLLYRILLNIPLPGFTIPFGRLQPSGGATSGLIEFIDMLSGGGLLKTSILGLGLLPFALAGQILQYLIPIVPALQRRMQDNPSEGRRFVEKWQYYLAVLIAIFEAWTFINFTVTNCDGVKLIDLGENLDILSKIVVVTILAAGSFFAVWMGSLISEFGIRGQGMPILILSGIIGALPGQWMELFTKPDMAKDLIIYILIFIGSIIAVIYLQSGRRNVPVMYPGRRMGSRMSMPVKATLPLMVNIGGTQGFIGSQLIVVLATFFAPLAACSNVSWINAISAGAMSIFSETGPLFGPVAFLSVFVFTTFYNDVLFQQQDYGENLRRVGGAIPGVDRGSITQNYLSRINRRITFVGGLIMGFLAITPWLSNLIAGTSLPLLDGERTVIMVGVISDAFMVLEAEIKLHGYQDSVLVR